MMMNLFYFLMFGMISVIFSKRIHSEQDMQPRNRKLYWIELSKHLPTKVTSSAISSVAVAPPQL